MIGRTVAGRTRPLLAEMLAVRVFGFLRGRALPRIQKIPPCLDGDSASPEVLRQKRSEEAQSSGTVGQNVGKVHRDRPCPCLDPQQVLGFSACTNGCQG